MLQFKEGAVQVLAADIREMLADTDRSLASAFKTSGLMPEVFEDSGLPARQSQRVYEQMSGSIAKVVEGRGGMVAAIASLQVFHRNSNLAETDTGCGDPWFADYFAPIFTSGSAAVREVDPKPALAE